MHRSGELPLGARGGDRRASPAASSSATSARPPTSTSARDGGRPAQVRGRLPRPRRQRAGDDLDDRRARARDVRERGLAGLHRHDARGGAGDDLDASASTPRTPGRCSSAWHADARRGASPGSASTGCARHGGELPLDRRARRPALRGRAASSATSAPPSTSTSARRWRRSCARSTSASTRSPRRSSAACCRSACRASRGSRSPPATCRPGRAPRSAATGTTRSSARTAGSRWSSATWSATACAPRRSMGQLRNAFRAYGLAESSPAEVMARVNRLVMSGEEDVMATVLYLVLDRETGEVCLRERRPSAAAGAGRRTARASSRAAARSRSARSTRPCSARRRRRCRADASLLLYTDGLVERRDEPLERRLDALAEAADRAEGGLEGLCDAVLAGRARPAACPATTWRCWRCARGRWPSEAIRFTLPAEPESLPGPAPPAGALPPRGRRRRGGDLRDHPDGLRGGRQRDRARLRPGRRDVRRRGAPRRATSSSRRCATAGSWRERRGSAPRPRAEHHRGPDGPGRGLDRAGGHGGADEQAAGSHAGRVSTLAEIEVERQGGTVVARLSGEVDMTNAAHVREQLLDAVPNDALALVVDLDGCRYLDSAAIEVALRPLAPAPAAPPGAAPGGARLVPARARAGAHRRQQRGARSTRLWSPRWRSSLQSPAPREGDRWRTNRRRGSATWPWSATEAAGRPPSTRRSCSRPARSTGSARWQTAPRSPTRRPTRRRARCRSPRASRRFAGRTARST